VSGVDLDPIPLTPTRVGDLSTQYRTHQPSAADRRRCAACAARFPCWYRLDAQEQLTAAGHGGAL